MSDLVHFLLARIDEDEAAADQCDLATPPGTVMQFDMEWPLVVRTDGDRPAISVTPSRVRADCEAKRRWIRWVQDDSRSHLRDEQRHTLRFMAAPYADHPHFREEWRA